jgi:hypothetical protein
MIILIVLAFAVIASLQMPKLIKQKSWKELVAFSIFFVIAFVLNILLAAGVDIPNPMMGIKNFLDAINLHY